MFNGTAIIHICLKSAAKHVAIIIVVTLMFQKKHTLLCKCDIKLLLKTQFIWVETLTACGPSTHGNLDL
jgi:hypothetical protein